MPLVETGYRYSRYDDAEYDDAIKLKVYDWDLKYCNFDAENEFDIEDLAKMCAVDYFHNHEGYVIRSWTDGDPLDIYIWIDENTKLKYEVYMEYEPTFRAAKV